jgi:uncharacterized protein YjiS (DUF1127 family)
MTVLDLNVGSQCDTQSRISLRNVFALYRSRRELAGLDESQLRDIGVARKDAAQEAQRAPWDVPCNWLK